MKFLILCLSILACVRAGYAIDSKEFEKLLGPQSAFVALDARSLDVLASHNAELALKPASVFKLATTAAALFELGPEFRFSTEAYVRERKGSAVDQLLVRGLGDPSLTIEELWKFSRTVRAYGVRSVGKIIIDQSSFVEQRAASGERAYQSGASALAFNFNSIAAKVCPGPTVGSPAVSSVDPYETHAVIEGQVRTIKDDGRVALDLTQSSSGLRLQISGTIGIDEECFISYRSVDDLDKYIASVLIELLNKEGVEVKSGFATRSRSDQDQFLFAYHSKPLRQILDDLNHFSTNFIAQQVVYLLGEQRDGRFSFEKGLERIRSFLQSQHLNTQGIEISDGAGLSHDNRISAMQLVRIINILDKSSFAAEFRSSLPLSGLSGTLKHRDFELPSASVRAKTGTLDGVSSLAGIVRTSKGREIYFVILSNAGTKDQAIKTENRLVRLLYAD